MSATEFLITFGAGMVTGVVTTLSAAVAVNAAQTKKAQR